MTSVFDHGDGLGYVVFFVALDDAMGHLQSIAGKTNAHVAVKASR